MMANRRDRGQGTQAESQEVRAIYEELATRPLNRNCTLQTECCHFKLTGLTPHLTKGEALVAARALRATGRRKLPERPDGACPLLHTETARCLIYQDRPFGCRTHFCPAAGGPAPRASVVDLIHRLEAIDGRLNGQGARPLEAAVTRALQDLG